MNTKSFSSIVILLIAICSFTNKGLSQTMEAITYKAEISPYKHVSYSGSKQIAFNADAPIAIDQSIDVDFITELIGNLDSTISNGVWNVLITNERVLTPSGETLEVVIYDFELGEGNNQNMNADKEPYTDYKLSSQEIPVSCRMVLKKDIMYSVCTRGFSFNEQVNDIAFLEYLELTKPKRVSELD